MKNKTYLLIAVALLLSYGAKAQSQDIVKTGLNFGPLPAVAYDADKGFQLGGILNIYNYGDGSNYPNYNSKWYFEASFFTKGSQLYQIMYDNKTLIPSVRWSSALVVSNERAMDFYGFNGYQSYLDHASIAAGKKGDNYIFTPFYRNNRVAALFKSDFIGNITDHLKWEAGYHASYFSEGPINYDNVNKNKKDGQKFPKQGESGYVGTLYEHYLDWGLISPEEAKGGFNSSVRLGLVYDSRDKEGAPSKGIWAEGHVTLAPKFFGTKLPYYRYSLTFRHYVPIVANDKLTFAYRLNYEGTFGNSVPYYVLPYITVMGENSDRDGMGGYRTIRGLLRDRVVGLDMASYNLELRWRFIKTHIGKQNVSFGLNAFSDGTMVTRGRDLTFKGAPEDYPLYKKYINTDIKERPHITVGAGFRFIMNENFIVAFEYGMPITNFMKNSIYYKQDGTGAFYINTGFLF